MITAVWASIPFPLGWSGFGVGPGRGFCAHSSVPGVLQSSAAPESSPGWTVSKETSLGQEDPLEKEWQPTHILAWEIPWTEETKNFVSAFHLPEIHLPGPAGRRVYRKALHTQRQTQMQQTYAQMQNIDTQRDYVPKSFLFPGILGLKPTVRAHTRTDQPDDRC